MRKRDLAFLQVFVTSLTAVVVVIVVVVVVVVGGVVRLLVCYPEIRVWIEGVWGKLL